MKRRKKPIERVYPLTDSGMVNKVEFFEILESVNWDKFKKSRFDKHTEESVEYYDIPAGFDIETTSFYYKGSETCGRDSWNTKTDEERKGWKKGAIMYEWTFGVMGLVTYGRTWEEFKEFLKELKEVLPCRLIVYVHNLGFEFQFLRKYFYWGDVFSLAVREPVRAIIDDLDIELRDSLALTGVSLEKLAGECNIYKTFKMVGDLDYNVIRTPLTPLTETELKYCENDVRVIMNYITEQLIKEGNLYKIPMTKTGYVRRDVRKNCYKGGKNKDYGRLMKKLTVTPAEYMDLKNAFAGGFTHSNGWFFGDTLEDVKSYDFTSSYPAVMCCKYFPMSKGRLVDLGRENVKELLRTHCCIMTVRLSVEERFTCEHYLSESRCLVRGNNVLTDNGRIVKGEDIVVTVTELDLEIIKNCYKITKLQFLRMWVYKRGRLPREIVEKVIEYYNGKTTLKGVEGKEEEYKLKKENVNSIYGMVVMDIVRPEIVYSNSVKEWAVSFNGVDDEIEKYNSGRSRFTFYPWGVYITAWARFNLWTGIFNLKEDYVYSDTDSVKFRNPEKHEDYFKEYNDRLSEEMVKAMEYYKFDENAWKPKTITGEEKPLGFWDYDGDYTRFKTLGAKRYITESTKGKKITIAGVNKKKGAEFLDRIGMFESFEPGLVIPAGESGKLTHTYIDDEIEGTIKGVEGNIYHYKELSGVHLEDSSYELGISREYELFINLYRGGLLKK